MKIKAFVDVNREELSMIEVAHAILEEREDVMEFSDLVNQIQTYLEKSDSEIREVLPQFYTDLNIDGSFISLGENRWGLRSWYPIDSIDEEVTSADEEDNDLPRRKKRKKVNAFITDDEDAIDYNDDDPEDADLEDEDEDDIYVEDDDVEEDEEVTEDISKYSVELTEIGADEDIEDGDEVEGLTIVDDVDLEEDLDADFDEEEE